MFLSGRASTDCLGTNQSGQKQLWYTCNSNNFRGCCSVDPCSLPTCPDTMASSAALVTTTLTLAPAPAKTSESSSSTSTSTFTTSSTPVPSPVAATSLYNSQVSSTSVSAPITTSTSSSNLTSKNSTTPIIAGVVGGVGFITLLAALIWFCLRRRNQKQLQARRDSIAQYGLPNKDFILDLPPKSERSSEGDIFAAYGGRYESPRPVPSIPTPLSPPLPLDQRSYQQYPQQTNQLHITPAPPSTHPPTPSTPAEDKHIPDPEKTAAVRAEPPLTSHPAYHAVPQYSPPLASPAWLPDQTTHQLHSSHSTPHLSSLPSHPTHHIASLSTHPAFRVPSAEELRIKHASFPRRSPEIKHKPQFRSPKPSPRTSPNSSPPRHGKRNARGFQSVSPNRNKSPIPGKIELEAETVPASYLSPLQTSSISETRERERGRYDERLYPSSQEKGDGEMKRGNTEASTYSIPIGLGFSSASPDESQIQQNQLQETTTSPLISPQTPASSQMIGPLGPSLTSPTLDTCDYAYSIRSMRVVDGEGRDEKEVVSPVVSPMSPEMGLGSFALERERWSGATVVAENGELGLGLGKEGREDGRRWWGVRR